MLINEIIAVAIDYLLENRRNIIVTILSFIFITTIFTVAVCSDEGMKTNYIEEKLGPDLDFSFVVREHDFGEVDFSENLGIAESISSFIDEKSIHNSVSDLIKYENLWSIRKLFIPAYKSTSEEFIDYISLGAINGSIENIISNEPQFEGRFPRNPNEIMYITGGNEPINEIQEDYHLNQTIKLSYTRNTESGTSNHSVKITGIYNTLGERSTVVKTDDYIHYYYSYVVYDKFLIDMPIIEPGCFYSSNYNSFQGIMDNLNITSFSKDIQCQFSCSFEDQINLKDFEIKSLNIENFIDEINYYKEETSLYDTIWRYETDQLDTGYFRSNLSNLEVLESIRSALNNGTNLSFLLLILSISFTLFFSIFALNLSEFQKKKQIRLLKIQGINQKQMIGVLLIEGYIASLIGFFIGYLVGIGLTSLTIKSIGFFDFSFTFESIQFTFDSFVTIFIWNFILTNIIIFFRTYKFSKQDIMQAMNPIERKPIWMRFYFDYIALTIGIIGNYIFFTMIYNPNFMEEIDNLPKLVIDILSIIFIPFSYLLLFGGLLFLSRAFPIIIEYISKKSWSRFTNLFSYSLNTISKQKESAIRTILILSFIFSLILTMFTIPPVINANTYRSNYYEVGADCFMAQTWNENIEQTFVNNSDIIDFVPVGTFSLISQTKMDIFIIFPNFLNVSFFKESFCSSKKIEMLFNTNKTALVSTRGLEMMNSKIGDKISYYLPGYDQLDVEITGSFKFWPRLVEDANQYSPEMVISNDTITEFCEAGVIDSLSPITKGYYFKLSPNFNITALKAFYGDTLTFTSELIQKSESALIYRILWLHLNVLFLIAIVTTITINLLSGFKQIRNRSREIGIERSLGMKLSQLGFLLFNESFIIIIFSLIFGTMLGVIFSISLSQILVMRIINYNLIPSPIFFFPLEVIGLVIGALIIISLLASIIPIYFTAKQNIAEMIRN